MMINSIARSAALLLAAACASSACAEDPATTYLSEARKIIQTLEANSERLDAVYDFETLAYSGFLPPVLVEDPAAPSLKNPCSLAPCRIHKTFTPYCKASLQGPQCDPVSWRDYLFMGMNDPNPSLSSRDAVSKFSANLAELDTDFKGMSFYSRLASMGLVQHAPAAPR